MPKKFRIKVSGDLEAKLEIARRKARAQGVTLQGDTRSGSFSGLITGTYFISGGMATVTITSKPFIAPWEYVESQLRAFLGD